MALEKEHTYAKARWMGFSNTSGGRFWSSRAVSRVHSSIIWLGFLTKFLSVWQLSDHSWPLSRMQAKSRLLSLLNMSCRSPATVAMYGSYGLTGRPCTKWYFM
ncbi:rh98 [macacine betaherpesvirus 3]|uniref:Rh98 n=1 Tax=Rhesus cytomegalovirus (strain 68-1) TaxID=47929 RepID=Q7TFN6_RHCM6|nr:rh98 [macacine betaherpesvirus 3]AAP50624.1 rh98 [macacine betaherpesvirus 3]AAZ80598.1 rh98 [macacine betaherpesvirus 3]